jgi:membrane fusion protein, multidrug efflux system
VTPKRAVEVREIVTGVTEADETSVEKGLDAGDVVVIDGIDKLEQGSGVVVRMADAGGKRPQ